MPAEERNLAAARNGAQVIKYTSEQGGPWRAERLIDEHEPPGGWISALTCTPASGIACAPVAAPPAPCGPPACRARIMPV